MNTDPLEILKRYYPPGSKALSILETHSRAVAAKATGIARRLHLSADDIRFIEEACLLHDIGIVFTKAPELDCHGDYPYICHGYLGHDLLVSLGLPKHARVCERHTGAGITLEEISDFNLPLPHRQMVPESLPEEIIAYSDKFFSKNPESLLVEKELDQILTSLAHHGESKVAIFTEWHRKFQD